LRKEFKRAWIYRPLKTLNTVSGVKWTILVGVQKIRIPIAGNKDSIENHYRSFMLHSGKEFVHILS
jgi:hypothetical protein